MSEHDTPARPTAPARWLHALQHRASSSRTIPVLAAVAVVLFGLGWVIPHIGVRAEARFAEFYGLFGLVVPFVIVLVARAAQALLSRPDGYHGLGCVDSEPHPPASLGVKEAGRDGSR